MNADALLQVMIKKGIHQESFLSKEHQYRTCPLCADIIKMENPPVLLTCGHIICSSCLKTQEWICGLCNGKKEIKDFHFSTLLLYIETKSSDAHSGTFKFLIKSLNGKGGYPLQNINGTTTFESLLHQSPDFKQILKTMGEKVQINMGGKSKTYSQIKHKTINAFVKETQACLQSTQSGKMYEIAFQNRYVGGKISFS